MLLAWRAKWLSPWFSWDPLLEASAGIHLLVPQMHASLCFQSTVSVLLDTLSHHHHHFSLIILANFHLPHRSVLKKKKHLRNLSWSNISISLYLVPDVSVTNFITYCGWMFDDHSFRLTVGPPRVGTALFLPTSLVGHLAEA